MVAKHCTAFEPPAPSQNREPAVTPSHASATLFRTADGHCLVIGSWHGTVDQLAEYGMNPEELQGLTTIAAARIKAWSP